MRQLLIGFAVLLLFPSLVHAQQQISSLNYTVAQANATIAEAYAYVDSINESGYLIFEPNLDASYRYLDLATQVYTTSPNSAVFYAGQAESLAKQQYEDISFYREESIPVIVVIMLIFFFVLLKIMSPLKQNKGKVAR